MKGPIIYKLIIEKFRGLNTFEWRPHEGLNILLGGGDVGKTTILDAIGLLLNPTNFTPLSDADYHLRDLDSGFMIEAVMWLPPETMVSTQSKPSWPWEWNGNDAVVPSIGEVVESALPVYKL